MPQYDFNTSYPTTATIAATTTEALPARSGRKYAVITNISDQNIYLALGADAVQDAGIMLAPYGGNYTISGDGPFRGAVNAICASGGKKLSILEA